MHSRPYRKGPGEQHHCDYLEDVSCFLSGAGVAAPCGIMGNFTPNRMAGASGYDLPYWKDGISGEVPSDLSDAGRHSGPGN